jgi:hypothetical protein
MNHYVTLALTNRKSSVHLHALYSPLTALRMFTPRTDHLMVCVLYYEALFSNMITEHCSIGFNTPASYCNVLGVLFTMDVYFHSKTQHTTVKYNQQLSKHVKTIHCQAISALACENSTSAYSPSLNCHLLAPMIVFRFHPL